jgi:orotidine-5'-phosphate decarboxylase
MDSARNALCVALDGSDRGWIVETAQTLASEAGWLKLGLEAFTAHGPDLVRGMVDVGSRVFLDLKLHDIPNTVRHAAANCAAAGADLLTVHASGGGEMLTAAIEGVHEGSSRVPPRVVAVTLLTSLDTASLQELGIDSHTDDTVMRWTRIAQRYGLDGVVASAREASRIRAECGPNFLIVTPGIRPAGHESDDQRRAVTPAEAIGQGSDILVVGRPVTRAPSPVDAAREILAEIAAAKAGVGFGGV